MNKYLCGILCLFFILCFSFNIMAGGGFLFSNKGYGDKVEVKAFLVSEEAIPEIFSKKDTVSIKPQSYEELFGKKIFFLVNLKNKGTSGAWGILICSVSGIKQKIYVNQIPFKQWDTYIIPIGVFTWNREPIIPEVNFEWERLYAK